MNIKQKAREMFDEKFDVGFLYENTPINKNKSAEKIKSFIDQIIDMAVEEERERIREYLTGLRRPEEPPYDLTAWGDRERFRNHILQALTPTRTDNQ